MRNVILTKKIKNINKKYEVNKFKFVISKGLFKFKIFLLLAILFITISSISVSASLEINSPIYSGQFTTGISPGNITNASYIGESSLFYQQSIGNINDSIFSGESGFSFNTSNLSDSTEEETTTSTATSSSSGGGGGGIVSSVPFILDKSQISVSLNPGQVKTEEITITNTGNDVISVQLDNFLKDFVIIKEPVIALNPKESKTISLDIIARIDTIPDLYPGKIILSSGTTKKEILIIIEVESEGILLDVRAEILEEYKKILPGGEILSEMRLFNLGDDAERKDVTIEYIIRDYNGNDIVKEHESLAIETQASFIKRILIPEKTLFGNYILYVRATYNGEIASASDNFEVVSSKAAAGERIYKIIIAAIIFGLIVLSLIIYYIIYLRKRNERVEFSHELIENAYGYLAEGVRRGFSVKLLKQKLLEAKFNEKEVDNAIAKLNKQLQPTNRRKYFIYGLIVLFIIVFLLIIKLGVTGNITGNIIGNESSSDKVGSGFLWILPLLILIGLLIIYREKMFPEYFSNRIRDLIGKKVYAASGDYVGKVEEVIIGKNKIDSLKIKLDKKGKKKYKSKGIIIKYNHVKAIRNIVIIKNFKIDKK